MLKVVWHWFFHDWGVWGPVKTWRMIDGSITRTQERYCQICGVVEERIL